MTEAVISGLDRWLEEVAAGLDSLATAEQSARLRRADEVIDATRKQHAGLVRNFLSALVRAQHDHRVRELLTAGFRKRARGSLPCWDWETTRPAAMRGASMYVGLLFQALIDPGLAIEGERMQRAQSRLRTVLPDGLERR